MATNDDKPTKQELMNQVIEDKNKKIEHIIEPVMEKMDARQEAYNRMVNVVKLDFKDYYERFPERSVDQRSKDSEAASISGLEKLFAILDEYDISFMPKPKINGS